MPDLKDQPPTLDDVVRLYVICICLRCNWNLARVARVLGVAVKTVYNHMNRYEAEWYLEKNMKGKGWKLKLKGRGAT